MAIRVGSLPSFRPVSGAKVHTGRLSLAGAGPVAAAVPLIGDLTALGVAAAVFAPGAVTGLVAMAASLAGMLMIGQYRDTIAAPLRGRIGSLVAVGVVPPAVLGLVRHSSGALTREALLGTVLLLSIRSAGGTLVRVRRSTGRQLARAVIIGGGQLGRDIASILGSHPEYGLVPIGFVDDVEDGADLPLPLMGSLRSLDTVLREQMVNDVVVAYGPGRDEALVPILRHCQALGVTVRVVPRFYELGAELSSEEIWGLPLNTLRPPPLNSAPWLVKRSLDVAISGIALLVLSPLLGLVAAFIKLTSSGPVLFRQPRVGLQGRTIGVLKFRSMRVNQDSATTWNVENDPRVTRLGRWLRRTSLDELPQLINILKGDMSLVGPRPERPHFVEQFGSEIRSYDARHRVPAGLTGWAQVHGLRGDTSIVERTRFDNRYIDSWSMGRDLSILARTVVAVVKDARTNR